MANLLDIDDRWVAELERGNLERGGAFRKATYRARVLVSDYARKVTEHYAGLLPGSLALYCQQAGVAYPFQHFGVCFEFDAPCELALFDERLELDGGMRALIARFGLVMLENAYLDRTGREREHRGRFGHLRFHQDRSPSQLNPHSLYTRNPFDAEQVEPRTSSTLFIANAVAHLQCAKERDLSPGETGVRAHYELFKGEHVPHLLGRTILEHAWDAPRGTGEMSMIDNRTVLHASYYREIQKSYRIGVRYLG